MPLPDRVWHRVWTFAMARITPSTPTSSGTANLIAHAHSARPNLKVDCFWWIVFGLAAYPKMDKKRPKMAKMGKMSPKMAKMRPR